MASAKRRAVAGLPSATVAQQDLQAARRVTHIGELHAISSFS
jgi:hypothetical protein